MKARKEYGIEYPTVCAGLSVSFGGKAIQISDGAAPLAQAAIKSHHLTRFLIAAAVDSSPFTTCMTCMQRYWFIVLSSATHGIPRPIQQMYAPPGHKNEKEFNCAQRGHQNILENLPTHYLLVALAGVV